MDSFTFNKIAGALLGTCLIGMGINIVAEAIYEPGPPAKPGFVLPNPKPEEAGAGGEKKQEVAPIAVRLAKADPKRGESAAKVCGACHNFQEGAGAKVGPDLYAVVDRPKGKAPGFDYSAGMKGKGGDWTYADLDTFITKPSAYVSGTKMSYPGEDDPAKRADIIAYLRTLAKTPVPLPPVTEGEKAPAPGSEAKGGEAKGTEAKGAETKTPETKTAEAKPAPAASAPKAGEGASGTAAGGGGDEFAKLVAAADPNKGKAHAQICGACHTLKKGGGALIGPPLWNVVGRKKGSVPGYDYSAGLKAKGGEWTLDDLNTWLTNPAAYIPGTKMGYPGEASEKNRAEIVAYLRTLSDTPPPTTGAAAGDTK